MSTDTRLDLDIIEALDFAYTPSCESGGHGSQPAHDEGAAYALVRVENECGHSFDKFYCKAFTKYVTGPFPHTACGVCGLVVDATFTVITLVN